MVEPRFRFDPVEPQHISLLREWLGRPHVAQRWRPTPTLQALHDDYLSAREIDGTRAYIASLHKTPIGFIQCYLVKGAGNGWWESEDDPGARGIDRVFRHEWVNDPLRQ